MRWDRKAPPESNLHVYGKDDMEFRVYNVKRSSKRRDQKKDQRKSTKEQVTKKEMRILEKVNTSELFRLHQGQFLYLNSLIFLPNHP